MATVYHEGQRSVQRRAGVVDVADRVGEGIHPSIPEPAREFITGQRWAFLAALDPQGRPWGSVLLGPAGFAETRSPDQLRVNAQLHRSDPLAGSLLEDAPVALVFIEFESRKRVEVVGTIQSIQKQGFLLETTRVYSKCPKYIQARTLDRESRPDTRPSCLTYNTSLTSSQMKWFEETDTLFLASYHSETGPSISHRGGDPGFVRVLDDRTLEWPDYPGNSMFITLGNIEANGMCGIFLPDFETGRVFQGTGTARILWDQSRVDRFEGAERVVEFTLAEGLERSGVLPRDWTFKGYSDHNPA